MQSWSIQKTSPSHLFNFQHHIPTVCLSVQVSIGVLFLPKNKVYLVETPIVDCWSFSCGFLGLSAFWAIQQDWLKISCDATASWFWCCTVWNSRWSEGLKMWYWYLHYMKWPHWRDLPDMWPPRHNWEGYPPQWSVHVASSSCTSLGFWRCSCSDRSVSLLL